MAGVEIRALLKNAELTLAAGPHPDRAHQDAEFLLRFAIGRDRSWLLTRLRDSLSVETQERFDLFVHRRLAGEPLQYITGEAEFYRMPFRVTPDVLIPRPETELLVERAGQLMPTLMPRSERSLEVRRVYPYKWSEPGARSAPRILDVGTGSGAIAISIAHDWSEAAITATDLSAVALEVARGNAERLDFSDQVRFLQGDLLDPVAGERFELIVSNPPYVAERDREALSVEVRDHEPALALFAGEDGLAVYRRLIPAAFPALEVGGFLLLEIGYGQSEAVAALLADAGFAHIEFVPDLQGIPRVACGLRP